MAEKITRWRKNHHGVRFSSEMILNRFSVIWGVIMDELPATKQHSHFVQTDRASHEAWYLLNRKHPSASTILHYLVSKVGEHNAVVISQRDLARILGMGVATVSRNIKVLRENNWIEVRQIAGTASVSAYVINSRVAWAQHRDGLKRALFSAHVIVNDEDQPDRNELGQQAPLTQIPKLYSDERQLPSGDGMPPPAEPPFESMLPDLPVTPLDREDKG